MKGSDVREVNQSPVSENRTLSSVSFSFICFFKSAFIRRRQNPKQKEEGGGQRSDASFLSTGK